MTARRIFVDTGAWYASVVPGDPRHRELLAWLGQHPTRLITRQWSFTDCTSRAVIERLHLKRVLTLDHHFREFGALEVIP